MSSGPWSGQPMRYSSLCADLTLQDITNAQLDEDHETKILALKDTAYSKSYRTVCLPLTTAKWKERWTGMCLVPFDAGDEESAKTAREAEKWRLNPAFEMGEVTMTRLDEADGVTILVSEWLELDADDDGVRHDAEIALQQELAYASYLNIQSAILPAPRNRDHAASYARIVNSCLEKLPMVSLSVRLPIYNTSAMQSPSNLIIPAFHPSSSSGTSTPVSSMSSLPSFSIPDINPNPGEGLNATWETWDVIRSICDYNRRLTLTLDLTPALPTILGVLSKWAAESVVNIFLPSSTFIANQKGYPVLPKPTQTFIRDSMIHRPTIILSDVASGKHKGGEVAYSQYINHLERTSAVVQAAQKPGTVENFAQGYQDYLQAPLQPLMDNLPSATYQTFEQDPIKYIQYEEAMARAFLDRPQDKKMYVAPHHLLLHSCCSIICVAGAGRGPLVARCLKALERTSRNGVVYVVEKNPNAFVTLQDRKRREWGDRVHLTFGDMRVVDIPAKADILVTELLGSFGDNELSPECLDGAVRFLKADGISIPSSYTAHLAPLSSSKLYNEARVTTNEKAMETPYVVMFQAVNILSGTKASSDGRCGPEVQECWEFEHPRKGAVLDARGLPYTNSHNARSAKLRFYIPHAGILHGLAGYFEAVLYKNIGLSIHPHHKDQVSKDMLSWFPLFFPFKEPLYLPSNSELQVSIWRLTNERQVWYEWHAESFICIPSKAGRPEELQLKTPVSAALASGSPQSFASSPLIDSKEPLFARSSEFYDTETEDFEIVKIGHTSLHNPNGRSSWIGL